MGWYNTHMETERQHKQTVVILSGLRVYVNFYAYDDVVDEIWEYMFDGFHDENEAKKKGVDLDAPEDYVDMIQEEDVLDALNASEWQDWEDMD
jgi:hypothetical protein